MLQVELLGKLLKQELLQLLQEKDILLTQLHQHLQQHFLREQLEMKFHL